MRKGSKNLVRDGGFWAHLDTTPDYKSGGTGTPHLRGRASEVTRRCRMNPAFLEAVSRCAGGKSAPERRAALLEYTEQAVRQGTVGRPWERLVAGLVLGSEAFAQRLRRGLAGNAREQSAFRRLVPGIKWRRIVSELEHIRGEDWAVFSHRHGDWGRDAALRLGRRHGRYRLRELGELAGGRPGGQPVWPAPAAATATPAEDRES